MNSDTTPGVRLRCNVGGDYVYPDLNRPAVYREPCPKPPTHRYREIAYPEQPWGYRCDEHARWLDREHVMVEPFTRAGKPS